MAVLPSSTPGDDKSSPTPLVQTVNKLASSTLLASALSPSVFGQPAVFFTFVIAGGGSQTPTGSVTFKEGAITLAANVSLSGGHAAFSTSSLSRGSHTITASYAGDNNFTSSFSMNLAETVKISAKITAMSAAPSHSVSAVMTGLTPGEVARAARTAPASSLEAARVDHFFGAVSVGRRRSRPLQDEWLAPGP
jgi:hypothetical protein